MRTSLLSLVVFAALVAACGSDDGSSDTSSSDAATTDAASDSTPAPADTTAAEPDATAPVATDAAPSTDAAGGDDSAAGGGAVAGATATLELATGETYEFSILCALDPQMAAGSEILFTAVSYDDPGLDVTQFGDEGTVTELAVVTVYDADYETLWEAGSLFEALGGGLELSLDGSSIIGSGAFYAAGDPASEPVQGELQANC